MRSPMRKVNFTSPFISPNGFVAYFGKRFLQKIKIGLLIFQIRKNAPSLNRISETSHIQFAPCWDTICGTQHLKVFRRQLSPSSCLWCGQIVSNLCVLSSQKIPTLASISSLSVVTPENDQ